MLRFALLVLPLTLIADDLEKLHLLAVDEVYVQGVTQFEVSDAAKAYDCSIDERADDWDTKVKSSKKRYFFQGSPDDPYKDFNCAFNNEDEALLAKVKLMHNCISSGAVACHIGGTGDTKPTKLNKYGVLNSWMLLGGNDIKKEQLLLKRSQLMQLRKQLEPYRLNCISFGYSDEKAIAECVERQYLENLKSNKPTNAPAPRSRSASLGDILGAMGREMQKNPVFNPNYSYTKICNFKNFEGRIIQGDCKKNSIGLGYDTYWRQ